MDGASTLTVNWATLANVDSGANSPKITFTSTTSSSFTRTVRVSKDAPNLLLPARATHAELLLRPEVVSASDWSDGWFLPPDTYDMKMTVYNPLSVGAVSGEVSVVGIEIVEPCIAGTWSLDGYGLCTNAVPGHYVDTSGATSPKDCPAGVFTNQVGATQCLPSPFGYYVAMPGSDHAEPCAAGSYQPQQGQSDCIMAPPGHFVAASGSERMSPCAAGSYQPQQGQVDCLVAPANTYVDSNPSISTANCPAGSTSAKGSSSLSDCIQPQALLQNAAPPACSLAVNKIVSPSCVAKALSVSLAGARSVVLRPLKANQAACRIVKGRIKTIATGVCNVVLVVKSKQGKAVTHRASVTVTP